MTQDHLRGCRQHFSKRVNERICPTINGDHLWHMLRKAIATNHPGVTFIMRISRKGRRLWRFDVNDEPFFLVYDHQLDCPITVMRPTGETKKHNGLEGSVNLEDLV